MSAEPVHIEAGLTGVAVPSAGAGGTLAAAVGDDGADAVGTGFFDARGVAGTVYTLGAADDWPAVVVGVESHAAIAMAIAAAAATVAKRRMRDGIVRSSLWCAGPRRCTGVPHGAS
jgi:hypothetical protein